MGRATTIFSAVFLALGGFLFGYDSGIITSTIALPTFVDYFGTPSDSTTGGIVSAFQGGAILGTIINMFAADWLGRRRTVFAGSAVSCLGASLQAGAVSIPMIIVGRFIGGVAVGMLTSTIPMYAGELSEAKFRGILSGLLQWMLSWGFLVAQWLGYGCSFVTSSFSCKSARPFCSTYADRSTNLYGLPGRFPLAFQNLPSLILLVGIFFLDESPRWLMEKDRHEEARAVLDRLRSGEDPDLIELELQEIRDAIVADRAVGDISWKSILTRPTWRKRLLLGCGVQAFGPLSGINVMNYYGPRIYGILGISAQTSLMIIGISGALSIVYCTVGLWLLEKAGRVKPLIVSAAGLAAALLVNAVQGQYFGAGNGNQLRSMVAMNFVFSLFYTPLGIISWVYPAEIFPVEVRALGNAITTFTNWTVNLIFAQFTPDALTAIEFKYFYVFFVFNLVAVLCYTFFYPETMGRTLEQMDELFGDHAVDMKDGVVAKKEVAITQEAE
jgi:sugar porter (SP) family MFS transporter